MLGGYVILSRQARRLTRFEYLTSWSLQPEMLRQDLKLGVWSLELGHWTLDIEA